MKRPFMYHLSNFIGGEAAIFPIANMNPKYSMKLQNCHISDRVGVAKNPGYAKVNSIAVAETLRTGYEFRKKDGTVIILSAGGGKIYKVGAGNELTAIKTGLNTGAKVYFATMNDICIMTNGVDAAMKYDGTTVSALGGTPPATAFKAHVHKNRVWMIERENKMLATHSDLNNPEAYASGAFGFIDFKYILPRGDELLDVITYIDLLVFKFRNHIAIYSGNTPSGAGADFNLVQLIERAGVVGTNVALGVGTDIAFLYDSGVKTLRQVVSTGDLNVQDVAALVAPTIQAQLVNATHFAAAHYPKKSWLFLMIDNFVFIYSYVFKAWGRMIGADVKGLFSTADGKLYICGTGYLYEYGSTWAFAGVSPAMIWETAWLRLSRNGVKAFPKIMEVVTYPDVEQTVNFQQRFDMNISTGKEYGSFNTRPIGLNYIDSVTDWDALNPIDEVPFNQTRVPLFGGGKTMQLIFSNTSNQPVEISNILLMGEYGGF